MAGSAPDRRGRSARPGRRLVRRRRVAHAPAGAGPSRVTAHARLARRCAAGDRERAAVTTADPVPPRTSVARADRVGGRVRPGWRGRRARVRPRQRPGGRRRIQRLPRDRGIRSADAPLRRPRRMARDRGADGRRVARAQRARGMVVVNLNDPLRRPEPGAGLGGQVREATSWLVDVLFERVEEREAPEPPVEAKACRLRAGRRIGCVSLVAGCGTTTLAALIAQRSGGAGGRVRLVDLDLAAPTIALLAGQRTPTLLDALAEESVRGRRWGSVDAIFGADRDPGPDVAESLARFVRRMSTDAAGVLDAGTLAATACEAVLHACDTVVYVTTPRAAHVHAA